MRTLIPIDRGQHSGDRGQFPCRRFNGSLGVVRVKLAPLAGFFRWLTQGLAVEGEAVRGVHESVEHGIVPDGRKRPIRISSTDLATTVITSGVSGFTTVKSG